MASSRSPRELATPGRAPVPWIVPWTGEPLVLGEIVATHRGIAYVDELPADRGRHGELLRRGTRPVADADRGRPLLGKINHARQRRSMRRLLCQVCGLPADRTDAGTLWVLDSLTYRQVRARDFGGVRQLPVCLPCAWLSVRACPILGRGYVAVRVSAVRLVGVYGVLCAPAPLPHHPGEIRVVAECHTALYDDPALPWVLASETQVALCGVTIVDLEAEGGAGSCPR
ncbi:hypothetical protein [Streptomyces virginiae]|uniref:hypothetical protein n=1 Tax=Streptomyces virginiae TaxID=1961 RepID=UPI003866410E|nr:hypothetical protein OG253_41530 [Streptomyces virginiae]